MVGNHRLCLRHWNCRIAASSFAPLFIRRLYTFNKTHTRDLRHNNLVHLFGPFCIRDDLKPTCSQVEQLAAAQHEVNVV